MSSRQEVTRKSGNWTKRCNWSAGLKHERRLAVVQPTPERQKKAHVQPVAGTFDAHTRTQDRKLKKIVLGGGRV